MTGAFVLLSYLAGWDPPRPGRVPRMPPQHLASASLINLSFLLKGLQNAVTSVVKSAEVANAIRGVMYCL
jgi:hypothetical protein